MSPRQLVLRPALAVLVMLSGACASDRYHAPAPVQGSEVLERVAATARQMIGAPYKFGGRTPRGFDCSGLVFYAYGEAGVVVPRTARAQLRVSHSVTLGEAAPGDLLFFREKRKVSHVGIYLGGQRFVHAPSTGKAVVTDTLEDDYYQHHLIRIARLDAVN